MISKRKTLRREDYLDEVHYEQLALLKGGPRRDLDRRFTRKLLRHKLATRVKTSDGGYDKITKKGLDELKLRNLDSAKL